MKKLLPNPMYYSFKGITWKQWISNGVCEWKSLDYFDYENN